MYKECNIHLLPSNEKPKIGQICKNNIQMFIWTQIHEDNDVTKTLAEYKRIDCFNLYITDDSKIKEGDWYIHNQNGSERLLQCNSKVLPMNAKKIIATTDTSLKLGGNTGKRQDGISIPLPQIPKQFIGYYINEYNKGNKIERVLVEFESYHGINTSIAEINAISGDDSMNWRGRGDLRDFKLKLSPTNEISIKPVENKVYTRDEVEKLIYSAMKSRNYTPLIEFNEWIKENLK